MRKSPVRHQVKQHMRKTRPVRTYTRGSGFYVVRISKRKSMESFAQTRPDPTLLRLFKHQDSLIEHRFPTSNYAEYKISSAGDIYREMTNEYPHWSYIDEKITDVGSLTYFGMSRDYWEGVKEYQARSDYKEKRDKYLRNLQVLEEMTRKANIPDAKRKQIMLQSLALTRELINYYEGNNRAVVRKAHEAKIQLDHSLDDYFAKEISASLRR